MALVIGTQESSSSSNPNSSTSRCSYDVFLSFRGEDTRKTFTDHLYAALVNASFRTFRDDDELERGEDIKLEFVKAIQQSRSSVVVFSKDYSSSRWCLNELVMILKRKKTSHHVVLPVFYDVDPSHLRKQTGSIAKAFARHQKTQSFDTVKGWREALAEAADLAGMVLQNEEDGEFGNLSALCSLDLGGNPIHSLPACIRGVTGLRRLSFEDCKRLKSLVRLPTVGHLIIADCSKLETVTFQSLSEVYSRMRSIECRGNHKLVEFESVYKMEPIERVDIEMITILGLSNLKYSTKSIMKYKIPARFHRWIEKRLPIQGLHEFGIFSTFLPGNYEVPQYDSFSHKSRGPSISFTVPVLPCCSIRGLNIFSVYEKSKSNESPNIRVKNMIGLCYTIMIDVRNKSKGLQWIYGPALFGIPSDDQDVIWLSHWKFGNKLEGGDELTVSVLTSSYIIYDEFQVKEFGVQVVYYEQEEKVTVTSQENFTTDNPFYPRVIAGDLSHYLLPGSSGTYLLCHNPVLERRDVLSYVWFKHNSNEITGHGSLGLKFQLVEQEEDRESECTLVEHEESSGSNSNSIDSNGAGRGWKVGCTVQHSGTNTLLEYESKYKIEPIERVDVDMMNLWGLYEYSTFSTFLPGNYEAVYSELEEKMISTQDKTADDPFYPHVISGDLSGYMMFGTYSRPAEEGRWYHHTAPDCLSPTASTECLITSTRSNFVMLNARKKVADCLSRHDIGSTALRMAASSAAAAAIPPQEKYDVFLSFRGEDTRNTLTSHLYAALSGKISPT
ncbi:hypothetical protein DVH24_010154 [Malus domestica]|uniref:ADP-ribosyl cyclase/cyclic ADP-ribose hydrolase n=1 Tax=Malus domestica TaxID=3750 RepID=A0A498JPG0_MALDO|nr:hypothetical protein DVH24_010154 [Malus domestica]